MSRLHISKVTRSLITLLLLSFLFCITANANQRNDSTSVLSKKLDEYIKSAVSVYKFNGAVLIARKGEVILQKGYGYKNFALKSLNDTNSVFQIGSLTKSFTAAVILKLQEEGKLSVDDKLSKYFPQVISADKITLRELLNHTSGLYNYVNDIAAGDSAIVSRPMSRQKVLDMFARKKLQFKPGKKYSYCNSDYYLLGMIIEKITGMRYDQAIRKWIFEPLGMKHSGFDYINLKDPAKASGYVIISATKYTPNVQWDSTVSCAAGAIYSTTGDLFKWNRAIATQRILSRGSWEQAFTPGLGNYGYGWWIRSMFNRKCINHGGRLLGFMSSFTYYPDDDITIILLINFGNYRDSLGRMDVGLSRIMLGQPYSLWK
jgi:CubicO group peptidase (beta-lactamase class C family)